MSGKLGTLQRATPRATVSPTYGDLRQAVGFLEGEGTFCPGIVAAGQKQDWPLAQLQRWFGGSLRLYKQHSSFSPGLWMWRVAGARARGVMMTLYPFLSPRRQEQIRRALR